MIVLFVAFFKSLPFGAETPRTEELRQFLCASQTGR